MVAPLDQKLFNLVQYPARETVGQPLRAKNCYVYSSQLPQYSGQARHYLVERTSPTTSVHLKKQKEKKDAINSVGLISKHELIAISGNITLLFRLNVIPSPGGIQRRESNVL